MATAAAAAGGGAGGGECGCRSLLVVVLGARASPPPRGVGFVCDEVCLLPVAGRAGAEAGCGGGGGKDALFVELWKACAGPLSSVPPLGEKVYYFPQGHIEQVRQTAREGALTTPGLGAVSCFCC